MILEEPRRKKLKPSPLFHVTCILKSDWYMKSSQPIRLPSPYDHVHKARGENKNRDEMDLDRFQSQVHYFPYSCFPRARSPFQHFI